MEETWAISGVDLHLDLRGPRPRSAIERALRDAVRGGRLVPGTRLPSSRALARDLEVARNTVAEAYAQLVAEGWLVGRPGSGTVVADRDPASAAEVRVAPPTSTLPFDLGAGAPDISSFPRSAWLAAGRRAVTGSVSTAFGYGDPQGLSVLREALTAYLARVRGVQTSPDRLVICSGFTQGLDLLAQVLVARGRATAVVEAYGQPAHRRVLERHGLSWRPLTIDHDGAQVHEAGTDAAMLLTPAHQFPIGSVLGAARRRQAAAWAVSNDALIVEDDYDGEFRYDRHPVGAMQPMAPEHVVYAGTASKTLAPGLRLGWLALPAGLVAEVVAVQAASGAQPGAFDQLTMAELVSTGAYDRHVRQSRLRYRRRRDRLVTTLQERFPGIRVSGVAAGLHLLAALPTPIEEHTVLESASRHGLSLQGLGDYASGPGDHPPSLVVGYGRPPEHDFAASLDRLVLALIEAQAHSVSS